MRYSVSLLAAGILTIAAGSAQASVTFNLTNVNFISGGSLTGSFTTNDALTAVTSFNIAASAAGAFLGFNYTTLNSSVTAQTLPSQYFQIDSTGNINELRIFFASALTMNGATISGSSSYEHEPSGGNRFFTGSVTRQIASVPEPASWAMMIAGFGLVGAGLRQRRRAGIVFA